jgi:uncharacterized protein YeaO (DUF488 family)
MHVQRLRPSIKIKRIYEAASSDDGLRILVDQLWPRGIAKKKAQVNLWFKDIAPSTELRKWFGHDPARWEEFQKRYAQELREKQKVLGALQQIIKEEKAITLLYAASDENHNNAVVLRTFLAFGG